MKSMSIQARLTLAVSLLLVVALGLLGWGALAYFEKAFQRTIAAHQYGLVAALGGEIDEELRLAHRGLTAMAKTFPRDFAGAQDYIARQSFAQSLFENGLALLSPDGRLFAIEPFEAEMFERDFSHREYLQETLRTGQGVISKPFHTLRAHGRPIVMLTAPIFNDKGAIWGVLLGSLDLTRDNILGKLSHARVGETGYLYLFASDRTMIMHPDLSRIMQRDVPPGVNPLFDRALEGFEGSGETVNSRGVPMLVSYKQLQATDWILGATTPLVEAYAPIKRARLVLLLSIAAVALLSIGLVWLVARRLTAPLRDLTRHVKDMGDKQGEARMFTWASADEIGTLGAAFNHLVAEIDREAAALQRSEALLCEAQRMARMGHWEMDSASGGIQWSAQLYRILGVSSEQPPLNREEYLSRVHPEDRPWVQSTVAAALNGGGSFVMEHRILRPDGDVRLVHSETQFYRDAQGRTQRLFGTLQDITERKRSEVELQELLAAMAAKNLQIEQAYAELKTTQSYLQQQEKMASIGQLAAGVAHEINNPLGYISSNLGTLEKYLGRLTEYLALLEQGLSDGGADLAQRRDALKIPHILEDLPLLLGECREGTARVTKIVQDLKTFSRLDDGETVPADLRECLESAVNIAWNEIKYKAELVRDYEDLPPLMCRPRQLSQVFMNLLVNAAQAMERQGTIRLSSRREGAWVCIAVRDEGRGIAPEHLSRLFDPFFTTKEVGQGTGLGLSIAYEIVKNHGGEILVKSRVGEGSTFRVRLPLSQVGAEPEIREANEGISV